MDHITYKKEFVPNPYGLVNLGATCWLNALTQSILSLSSVLEVSSSSSISGSAGELNNIFKKALKSKDPQISVAILKGMLKRSELLKSGQQCAGEGFNILLECVNEDIERLFKHRTKNIIYCKACDQVVVSKRQMNNLFEVDRLLETSEYGSSTRKSMDLYQYIHKLNNVVEGFKCPSCGDTSDKPSTYEITMVPEVLTILFKKYVVTDGKASKRDGVTMFPEILTFDGYDMDNKGRMVKKKFKYCVVAQIEHSGSLNSGHYWAIVKRHGKWYEVNDYSVSPGTFGPTRNTYMVFYHII